MGIHADERTAEDQRKAGRVEGVRNDKARMAHLPQPFGYARVPGNVQHAGRAEGVRVHAHKILDGVFQRRIDRVAHDVVGAMLFVRRVFRGQGLPVRAPQQEYGIGHLSCRNAQSCAKRHTADLAHGDVIEAPQPQPPFLAFVRIKRKFIRSEAGRIGQDVLVWRGKAQKKRLRLLAHEFRPPHLVRADDKMRELAIEEP